LSQLFLRLIQNSFLNQNYTLMYTNLSEKIKSAFLGLSLGDALGVPYEFKDREEMDEAPITGMVGDSGCWNQPAGTWSDDSSMAFCLAESLVGGYNAIDIAKKFIAWRRENLWTARGSVFDIGSTTQMGIMRLERCFQTQDFTLLDSYQNYNDESQNGNGALMRTLPFVFYLHNYSEQEQFEKVWQISSMTHQHIRSAMSCFIYLKLAEKLLLDIPKKQAYNEVRTFIKTFWDTIDFPRQEREKFSRIIEQDISQLNSSQIKSDGYVIHTLESALYVFLKYDNYKDIVFAAINLGDDTDTTACVAGGIAGICHGLDVPERWLNKLARTNDIIDLATKTSESVQKNLLNS